MKKLFIFFTAVALTAMGAKVFAQSTGLLPNAGYTHSYWVNTNTLDDLSSGHLDEHEGSIYKWQVLRADGAAADNSDYQFVGNSEGENQFSVQIKWLSPAIADGNPYFLVVTEEADGCKNMKAMQIDPQNAFAVVLQNVDEDLFDLGAGKEWCAPDITLNLADANIVYNYGTTTLYYRVDAQGLDTNWSFDYEFTETGKDANSTVTAYWGADVLKATTELDYAGGGTININGGAQDIIIKVIIKNETVAEGETANHNILLTLSQFSDGENAPISINGESVNETNISQTIKARPATSGIQTN